MHVCFNSLVVLLPLWWLCMMNEFFMLQRPLLSETSPPLHRVSVLLYFVGGVLFNELKDFLSAEVHFKAETSDLCSNYSLSLFSLNYTHLYTSVLISDLVLFVEPVHILSQTVVRIRGRGLRSGPKRTRRLTVVYFLLLLYFAAPEWM